MIKLHNPKSLTFEDFHKKNNNTKTESKTNTTTLKGVDDSTLSNMASDFAASNEQTKAQESASKELSNFQSLASNKGVISDRTWDSVNTQFVVPSAVTEADAYLKSQLSQIQSGKTSYTDQIKDMMSQIMNRDKFSYDVDADPLFQQALASAMNSGKTAMQDTIGQASALTGGYGSTYATSVGNQAYNAFIEDAYNNLPQYYQMAMEAYQAEGDEMYRQLGMLSDADATEYGRMVDAYNATSQYRNQMYNEAYSQYRDYKSDAFGMANLQLSENQQILNNALNSYQASADYANTMYEREYQNWADKVSQATNLAGMLNQDWWNQTNFDEAVRQYGQNFAEEQRQFDTSFAEEQRRYNQNYTQTEKWNQNELDYKNSALDKEYNYKYAALQQDQNQFDATMDYNKTKDSTKSGYVVRKDENGNEVTLKEATQPMMEEGLKAYNEGGTIGLKTYLASVPESYDIQAISDYAYKYGEEWVSDYDEYSDWKIDTDTHNAGGWLLGTGLFGTGGEDHNDTYKKGDGNPLTYDQLKEKINNSNMPKEKKEELLNLLKKQSKN